MENSNRLSVRDENKIALKLSFIEVLKSSDLKFYELIKKIESNSCYKLLLNTCLTRKRFFYAWNYHLNSEEFASKNDSKYTCLDIISDKEKIISIIRKLGVKKFEFFFLNDVFTLTEISKATGIEVEIVRQIRDFVRSFILLHQNICMEKSIKEISTPIAAIEAYNNKLFLEYITPFYADGLYIIDNKKLKKLKKENRFKGLENELRELLFDIEKVNFRKKIIHSILLYLIAFQRNFILTKGDKKLLSMRELARRLGVNVSIISRAITGKYVKLPDGNNLKLKDLFCSRKAWKISQITRILEKNKKITGKEIADLLFKKTGVRISLRTANYYKRKIILELDKNKKELRWKN